MNTRLLAWFLVMQRLGFCNWLWLISVGCIVCTDRMCETWCTTSLHWEQTVHRGFMQGIHWHKALPSLFLSRYLDSMLKSASGSQPPQLAACRMPAMIGITTRFSIGSPTSARFNTLLATAGSVSLDMELQKLQLRLRDCEIKKQFAKVCWIQIQRSSYLSDKVLFLLTGII